MRQWPTKIKHTYSYTAKLSVVLVVLTISIIVNAIASNFSCVDPDVGFQIRVVCLYPRVNDANSNVVAACSLCGPVTWGLHQIQVVQGVTIGGVSILHIDLVVQRSICHICMQTNRQCVGT